MPVTHIEEREPRIKSIVDITDAMLGVVAVRKQSLNDKLDEAIIYATRLKKLTDELEYKFSDKRGNLEESKRFADDLLDNLIGHKSDVLEGIE